jgi:uncharacterized protein (DUF2249 family)
MDVDIDTLIDQTGAPDDRGFEEMDVRQLGPPKPLSKTLEMLTELDRKLLVQFNDRAPQHLYPKLEERGYQYETVETGDSTVTLIWSQ